MKRKRRSAESEERSSGWTVLNNNIVDCTRCSRLIAHCRKTADEKRAAYRDHDYWGRPVPNFGDPDAQVLIVGLAPAAHGANRTGRMFTGDRSGDWLFRSLYKTGFASQPNATDIDDGLVLTNCAITAACHCAPPANKPSRDELANCAEWLETTFHVLPVRVIVALGGIGWDAVWRFFRSSFPEQLLPERKPKFGHKAEIRLTDDITLLGSYHPSQQNTFTGRLTEPMLNAVFRRAARLVTSTRK